MHPLSRAYAYARQVGIQKTIQWKNSVNSVNSEGGSISLPISAFSPGGADGARDYGRVGNGVNGYITVENENLSDCGSSSIAAGVATARDGCVCPLACMHRP